jgi:hypothetical protein
MPSVKNALERLKYLNNSESGSASVEFVLLAIPLFLPIILFLNHFATLSNSELVIRTLVRESLRAYVTSPNNEVAPNRAWQVLSVGGRAEGLSTEEISNLDLKFQCSKTPCISEGGRIRATLKMQLPNQDRTVSAQAEEFISPWQWNGNGHGLQPSMKIDMNLQDAIEFVAELATDLIPIP